MPRDHRAMRVDTLKRLCYNAVVMSLERASSSPSVAPRVEVIGITGIPEIVAGDRLGEIIVEATRQQDTPIEPGDILVVTQKVVSKSEGRVVDLNDVEPSASAVQLAGETGKDPRLVELMLDESRSIVRVDADRGIIITETRHGFVCANAGIDSSNVPGDDLVCLLPKEPDESADSIREQVLAASGVAVAVIISDTFGRAWREGHVNFAIGISGMDPMKDYRGLPDAYGTILKVTTIAVADELAAAAELATGKSIHVPAALVKGYEYSKGAEGVQSLLRERSRDLFR